MSNDSSFNKNQFTKRNSTFILPTKRNKKPCTVKPSTISESTNINKQSPIFLDLDYPLIDSTATKSLYDIESPCAIDNRGDLSEDEVDIAITDNELESLDPKKITTITYIELLTDNDSGDDSDGNTHIIDLTGSSPSNSAANVSPRPFHKHAPSTTPTHDHTDSTSPDLLPLNRLKERGAAMPHAPTPPPQLNVTPNAAHESNKADRQKRKTPTRKRATTHANQLLHSRPINTVCHQVPDYESLTLVELRNAVKKYGFKPKDRQSMIEILENVQSVLNTNSPTLDSRPLSIPTPSAASSSPPQVPPSDSSDSVAAEPWGKQEFANRIKGDIQLWEQILRYESVDAKTCTEGLSQKQRNAYHKYLDENGLIQKTSRKRK